jgi:hypothetical protein
MASGRNLVSRIYPVVLAHQLTHSSDSDFTKINYQLPRNKNQSFSLKLNHLSRKSSLPIMLDVRDFIAERGGNPEKIRESQRRRGEPVEVVDQIIEKFQNHRKSKI